MTAITLIKQIDEAVSVIARVATKLKADPDAAAVKLADALGEIEKSCRALDDALAKYLTLAFDSNTLREKSDVLLEIGGGGLVVTAERGRGHCQEIANIYGNFLDRWFDRVFKTHEEDRKELQRIFGELSGADFGLFDRMVDVAREAQEEANVVLDHVFNHRMAEAQAAVRASFKKLNPVRAALNELLARLFSLRAQFIQIARI